MIPAKKSINLEILPARFSKGSIPMIMGRKKSIPASIDNRPQDTAICIHIFLLEGVSKHMRPEMRIGHPMIAGIQEVMDVEPVSREITRAQITRNAPNNIVSIGIETPTKVNCFSKMALSNFSIRYLSNINKSRFEIKGVILKFR